MKIVLVTLTITLSVLLAFQDNKIKELKNENNNLQLNLNECSEGEWWVKKLELDVELLEDKLEECGCFDK
jgi:hypothetical protein